jgi:hypothetical protein
MGERSDEIRNEIEYKRQQLGSNLQELEVRVKRATDWRVQFEERPLVFLGIAFAVGLLLSRLGRRSSHVTETGGFRRR